MKRVELVWQNGSVTEGTYAFWTELESNDGEMWEVRTRTSHPLSTGFCPVYAEWQYCHDCLDQVECPGCRRIDRAGAEALLHTLGVRPAVLDGAGVVEIDMEGRGGPIFPVYADRERWINDE